MKFEIENKEDDNTLVLRLEQRDVKSYLNNGETIITKEIFICAKRKGDTSGARTTLATISEKGIRLYGIHAGLGIAMDDERHAMKLIT